MVCVPVCACSLPGTSATCVLLCRSGGEHMNPIGSLGEESREGLLDELCDQLDVCSSHNECPGTLESKADFRPVGTPVTYSHLRYAA